MALAGQNLESDSVEMSPSFDEPEKKNLKRKHEPSGERSSLPAKAMAFINSETSKNALCLLHKLYRNVVFNIINTEGPVHAPIFTASVEINGIVYEGQGKNKKAAKHSAAQAALRSLVQFKNPSCEGPTICSNSNEIIDFSSDVLYKEINNFDEIKAEGSNIIPNGDTEKNGLIDGKPQIDIMKAQSIYRNPVMLLNELHPDAKYEVVSDDGEQSCKYTIAVIINGKRFEEKGSSKKLGKAAAARSALLSFHKISVPACPISKPVNCGNDRGVPQVFADHISKIVNDKFTTLMKINLTHIRRKVLAGFVLSQDYNVDSCQVIAVSTGTKCVNGERLSVNGTVLNDSHAEVISRRCLRKFLYSELEKHLNESTQKESIFEKHDNGFRLKDKYKFHLYITTAPCGDARIFSPHDEFRIDKHPNRKARGKLRTKIECGEGTIPILNDFIQTWDGVLQGERLLTMSCSDKIAKWNVVGLQGALLSHFIEPIYLDSIILGSLFHPDHLQRAVCGRIEQTIQGLPPPYRLNEPKLSTILNKESRQIGKSPNFSVNWTIGDKEVEVVNAVTGKTEESQISRLAKCTQFFRFLRLAGNISSFTNLEKPESRLLYSQCKVQAAGYQSAKKQLFTAFSKAKLGKWVKKPEEVDQFEWDEESLVRLFYYNLSNVS